MSIAARPRAPGRPDRSLGTCPFHQLIAGTVARPRASARRRGAHAPSVRAPSRRVLRPSSAPSPRDKSLRGTSRCDTSRCGTSLRGTSHPVPRRARRRHSPVRRPRVVRSPVRRRQPPARRRRPSVRRLPVNPRPNSPPLVRVSPSRPTRVAFRAVSPSASRGRTSRRPRRARGRGRSSAPEPRPAPPRPAPLPSRARRRSVPRSLASPRFVPSAPPRVALRSPPRQRRRPMPRQRPQRRRRRRQQPPMAGWSATTLA